MLKGRFIFFHIQRRPMRSIYISAKENIELIDVLTTSEFKVYNLLLHSVLLNPEVSYYDSDNLANILNISISAVNNAKT